MKTNNSFWEFKKIDCSLCMHTMFTRECGSCMGKGGSMVPVPVYNRLIKMRENDDFIFLPSGRNKGKFKGPHGRIYTKKQMVGFKGNAKMSLLSKEEKVRQ